MLSDFILEFADAAYNNHLLLLDDDGTAEKLPCHAIFAAQGYEVIVYEDDLTFRLEHEEKLSEPERKIAVLADAAQFVPYDIQQRLHVCEISLSKLFPKLNAGVLRETAALDWDLLSLAYEENFDVLLKRKETESFLCDKVYGLANVQRCIDEMLSAVQEKAAQAATYSDWFAVAETKAKIDSLAAEKRIEADTFTLNQPFQDYVLAHFGQLTMESAPDTPVLVSRAMEFMRDHSSKFIIVVMDGMSLFDWYFLSHSLADLRCEQSAVFAMIPTTTAISRQCLLANKFPLELIEPWKQAKEEQEFINCAKRLGYQDNQIAYRRGYDADFSPTVRCGALIINEIDDIVHGQQQGRLGMANDMALSASQGKLSTLVKKFLAKGFDIYITADHGNTPCIGQGKLTGVGVETETRSRRMTVLRDFADKDTLKAKYGLIEYPKYFLPKDFIYLICGVGKSFDANGEKVMTHGGITIDEVIVPFIQIRADANNG